MPSFVIHICISFNIMVLDKNSINSMCLEKQFNKNLIFLVCRGGLGRRFLARGGGIQEGEENISIYIRRLYNTFSENGLKNKYGFAQR